MDWTLDTGFLLSKRLKRKFLLWGIALMALVFFSPSALGESDKKLVVEIESPVFSKNEWTEFSRVLGVSVGKPLDPKRLDEGIRELYRTGRIQSLALETTPSGKGIKVVLRGAKLRKLRKVSFRQIDLEIHEELRRKFPLDEGESVDNRLLSQLNESLKSAYEARGHYLAVVEMSLFDVPDSNEVDLEVTIQPNPKTIVSRILLQGGTKAEMDTLRGILLLKRGDAFTQKALEKSAEAMIRYLKNNQYPVAKIESTNVQFSENKREVEVSFLVSPGERFLFQFKGNTVFSDVSLRELLTEDVIAQGENGRRIADLIEKKYKQVGYHFAKVEIKTSKSDRDTLTVIRFDILEGAKVIVDKLDFRQSDPELEKMLGRLFFVGAPGVLGRKIYWEEGLDEAIKNLKIALEARGFLSPGISPPKSVFSEDGKGVDLIFDADLGILTRIEQIVFQGVNQIEIDSLKGLLPFSVTDPLDREEVKLARNRILEWYRNRGFLDAKFTDGDEKNGIKISADQKNAVVTFSVSEGQQFYVGQIKTQGNRKTKDEVLLKEMRLKTGDVYQPNLIQRSEDDINLLGLFSRAEILTTPSPDSPNRKDLTIVVRESKPGFGELGLGGVYEEPRLRLRTFFGIAYRNLMGLNHTATARTEIALPITRDNPNQLIPFIEYATLLGYRAPYPFSLPFTFSTLIGLDSFEVSTVGPVLQTRARIENRIERKLSDHLTGIYRLHRYERTRTDTRASSTTVASSKVDTIGSTGPGLILDLRDDIFNPTRGSLHALDLELAHPAILSQSDPQKIGFVMLTSRNSFFVPLVSPFSLSLFAGAGYAKSILPGSPLPTARLTYDLSLGGQNSIRGFSVRKFSPVDINNPNNNPTSSAFYNLRSELAIYLFSNLSAAIFWDTGQIYPNLRPEPRQDGVGIGVRYKTPVGPIVIDVAQGLGPQKEAIKFYFTVGTF